VLCCAFWEIEICDAVLKVVHNSWQGT